VITVRLATPADRAPLAQIFHDMEAYYEGASAVSVAVAVAALDRFVFAPGSGIRVMVAEEGGRFVAMASFSTTFPSQDLTGGLFVKDIYVAVGARNRGVGELLLRAIARHARERGVTRIDWAVQATNAPAVALYERIGARAKEGTRYMRLEGAALEKLAADDPAA
jgi:ribosomal protein S18 acetylase RimI-like enzyme